MTIERGASHGALRAQMVITVGAVVIALLGGISLVALRQVRERLVRQQLESSLAVARTFAIASVDALILGEQGESPGIDVLDTHVRTFMSETAGARAVSIIDPTGRILADSDPRRYSVLVPEGPMRVASRAAEPMSAIVRDDEGQWVVETAVPLRIGSKRWGAAVIRFDAAPLRRQIRNFFFELLFATLLVSTATIGLLWLLVGRITASLRALVREMDSTDFESNRPSSLEAPSNEVGQLIRHFEQMKGRLRQSRHQLTEAQHQVYQAEKLASVGRLASGVAHEVNNPLNGIKFCLHGIASEPENDEQRQKYLTLVSEGIEQIESIVQKLLGFARSQPATFEHLSLNEQVRVVLDLIDYQLRKKRIVAQTALDPELPAVRADATLVKEVFMNLLMNSVDAMDEGGRLRVQSGRADEGRVFVSVTDDGAGISPEHMTKIFEPFFTTKETGRGTGLGLAVTLGIVELHGGTIRVHSEPHVRTTFTVFLPLGEGA